MKGFAPLKRIALVSALGVSVALVVFAALVPSPEAEANLLQRRVIEPLLLAGTSSLLPSPERYVREERFKRRESLEALFARLGIAQEDAQALRRTPSLRYLRPGRVVRAETGSDGTLLRLSFLSARESEIVVERADDAFRAQQIPAPLQSAVLMRAGTIESSLFAAADIAGVPDSVAIQLADIFAGEVDFHRELRRGDRFAVVYEQYYLGARAVHTGRVLAAEFVNRGRRLRAVYFAPPAGTGGYYAPDGTNLRKEFLRSPLEYTRISSGFGMRRHPLLHRAWRRHTGVDYAAPVGTRVRAAGDGVVAFVGRKGGYGNLVVLRHRGRYSTAYAHLSRFAAGLRPGKRIAQGDIIAYVGATGWATGPHLHYEFRIAGRARNPYSVAMPAGKPVPAAELATFQAQAAPLVARLELLAAHPLARLE